MYHKHMLSHNPNFFLHHDTKPFVLIRVRASYNGMMSSKEQRGQRKFSVGNALDNVILKVKTTSLKETIKSM